MEHGKGGIMAMHARASGIAIEVPDDFSIEDIGAPRAKTRGTRTTFPTGAIPLPGTGGGRAAPAEDPVIGAMVAQDLGLVDAFDLTPILARTTRRGPAQTERSRLTIDVGGQEDSVVLFEQDGVYSWRYPEGAETVAPAEGRERRGPVRARPQRRIAFDLSVEPTPDPAARRTRGPVTDFVIGKVRVYVFRFVARVATGSIIAFLERKKRTGLVRLADNDPLRWAPIERLDALPLPSDRPARILLLVHGSFSSTLGSFGALGLSAWGRAFLAMTRARYDGIVGYDHRTLSSDPMQNAQDLLGRLEGATAPSLEIDEIG